MFRYRLFSLVSLLLILLIVSSPVVAESPQAENIKAAYVNMEQILRSDSEFRQAIKKLDKFRNKLQERIKSQRQGLQKLRKDLQEEGELLSKQQRQQKKQQLTRKMRSLQQRTRRSKQQLQKKKQELIQPILEKVAPVAQQVAQENGFNVIYRYGRSQDSSVLWVAESINLTEEVIQRLESNQ